MTVARAPNAARRWFQDEPAGDARFDEALRRVGADMLDEPLPETLLRALSRENAGAETSQHEESAGAPAVDDLIPAKPPVEP